MFVVLEHTILGRLALVGREGEPDAGQSIAVTGAGLVAGLTTAFTSSIWFSAVEGEVYAMSTFFTCHDHLGDAQVVPTCPTTPMPTAGWCLRFIRRHCPSAFTC
jgi:hypothetical protein